MKLLDELLQDDSLISQGQQFIDNMKRSQSSLLESAIKRSTDTRPKSKKAESSIEGIMQYARVTTIGGKNQVTAKQAWEGKLEEETKQWLA